MERWSEGTSCTETSTTWLPPTCWPEKRPPSSPPPINATVPVESLSAPPCSSRVSFAVFSSRSRTARASAMGAPTGSSARARITSPSIFGMKVKPMWPPARYAKAAIRRAAAAAIVR